MANCNFKSINPAAAGSCSESFSGLGTKSYFIPGAQFTATSKEAPSFKDGSAEYTDTSFSATNAAEVYVFPTVSGTAQVTASANAKGKGFSNVFTGRIEKNIDDMSANLRTMNNTDFFFILVDTGETKSVTSGDSTEIHHKYRVVGSLDFAVSLEESYDSGTTPDSDNGHTITVTASPSLYPAPYWWGILATPTEATGE